MTEKTLKKKIEKLGGKIKLPAWIVIFPEMFRINNKSEAIDLLDVIIQGKECSFNSLDILLEALKEAIKRGDI
ncbi:MAG: hypothetical protein FWB86_13330 [Treponema sp.]|nr:hypothetical protein [Treponema sp.]